MKILSVVGARPNFMKVAPILAAIERHNRMLRRGLTAEGGAIAKTIEHVLVHTGQHYDELMSGAFFRDLHLPVPDVHLGVGSGSHSVQTAEIMVKFEGVLKKERPDVALVVGDVNSTVACAFTAAKISFDSRGSRPAIAHVEAGLRSFDRSMPEEINRIVTDQLSDLLFVTEQSGLDNLRAEGVPLTKIHFVGNTMIDSLLHFADKAERSAILEALGLRAKAENGHARAIRQYALLTLHRPSNVDDPDTLRNILTGLRDLASHHPIVFPVHPRTRLRIREFGLKLPNGVADSGDAGFIFIEPLGYLDFVCLMKHSSLVVTDSGGIQEETTCLGVPCVTVRENTERPVTLDCGTNLIAGTESCRIAEAVREQFGRKYPNRRPPHWDGQAASRIVEVLVRAHATDLRADKALVAHPTA